MEKPKFEFYERPNGQVEFVEFLQSLPVKDRAKLLDIIQHVQEHGLLVAQRMEWVKKLDKEIFEIRSKFLVISRGLCIFMWLAIGM